MGNYSGDSDSDIRKARTFKKSQRLTKGAQFRHLKENGKVLKGRYMIISVTEAVNNESKAGFTVSKHYHKTAVKRNRAKRLLKEAYRNLDFDTEQHIWLVFIVRKLMLNATQKHIKDEMQLLLKQEGLLQD